VRNIDVGLTATLSYVYSMCRLIWGPARPVLGLFCYPFGCFSDFVVLNATNNSTTRYSFLLQQILIKSLPKMKKHLFSRPAV